MVDATELLGSIEEEILKAKEEALARREILDKMDKWLSACEEESWLEDYNKVQFKIFAVCLHHSDAYVAMLIMARSYTVQDDNRYNASKGAHINLKRAERARATVVKLPGTFPCMFVKLNRDLQLLLLIVVLGNVFKHCPCPCATGSFGRFINLENKSMGG